MILFKEAKAFTKWVNAQRKKANTLGFIPTMGALHQGHISLIEASKNKDNLTMSSIFVNPTQFNDPRDFKKYPVTLENDIYLLERSGCDALLLPSVEEIYPDGLAPRMHYDLGNLESILEGKYRPGHFQGVCNVVHRLLEIARPDHLYLGQKDYQQCMVLKRLMEIISPDLAAEIIICPTLREPEGLAMSSRNMRLDAEQRKKAADIYQSLLLIKENAGRESPAVIKKRAQEKLEKSGFKVDYVEIADPLNLSPVNNWDDTQKLTALVAASLDEVRLIDNLIINA